MGNVVCQSDGFLVLSYVFSALDRGNLDCCLWLVSLVGFSCYFRWLTVSTVRLVVSDYLY